MLRRPRRLAPLYVLWITLCAALFFGLRGAEDPSRPTGRILSIDAGGRALQIVRQQGLRGYEVVHVARARAGEGGAEERWIVLLDKRPRTRLREAIVVESRADTGKLLRVRKPNTEH